MGILLCIVQFYKIKFLRRISCIVCSMVHLHTTLISANLCIPSQIYWIDLLLGSMKDLKDLEGVVKVEEDTGDEELVEQD